jgi:hypothetical protein
MNVSSGGNSGAQDYYGVDQTWFSGSSFTRPIFDLANTIPTAAGPIGGNNVIWVSGGNVTFDNIEIKRQFIKGGHSSGNSGFDCGIYFNATSGNIVKNGYFHDWVSDAANINLGFSNCAGGIGQNKGGYVADNMTISDQFGSPVPIGGCFQNAVEVKNSHCSYVAQGALGYVSVHDSEFDHLTNAGTVAPYTNGIHTNVIEETFMGIGASETVYNNLIHDNNPIGVTILACSGASIYNNVMWNNASFSIGIDTNCTPAASTTTANIYNNTVDCSAGSDCAHVVSRGTTLGVLNLKNNHWITNGSATCYNNPAAGCSSIAVANVSDNITMSTTTANSQGYTSANQYKPTSSSGGTVGTALNLSSLCFGSLGSFCSDRLHAPRLSSWDAGAYQFGAQSQSTKPNPPSGLSASVQ